MRSALSGIVLGGALLAATIQAHAQSVVDDSVVPPDLHRQLVDALADFLYDPPAAQLRRVTALPEDVVCGDINAKNLHGGYTGFHRFAFDPRNAILLADAPASGDASIGVAPERYVWDSVERPRLVRATCWPDEH